MQHVVIQERWLHNWAEQTTKPIKSNRHERWFMPAMNHKYRVEPTSLNRPFPFLQILYGPISFLSCFTFTWRENSGVHRRHCHSGDVMPIIPPPPITMLLHLNLSMHRTKTTMTPLNLLTPTPLTPNQNP